MFRPFLRALRVRGAGIPLIAGFLGALPIGMLGLGVLLLVRATTGSFGWAGVAGGALNLGNAAGLAVSGRFIDRYGRLPETRAAAFSAAPSAAGRSCSSRPQRWRSSPSGPGPAAER